MTKEEKLAYYKQYYKSHKKESSIRSKNYRKIHRKKLNAYGKKYREINKNEIAATKKKHYEINKNKLREKNRKYHELHREEANIRRKKHHEINKEREKINSKKYREAHKEEAKIYNKKYRETHRTERNIKHKIRIKTDSLFRLICNTKSSIKIALKENGYRKKIKSVEILGCSFDFFKKHLESKFEKWMNWDNYGKYNGQINFGWDVDHIIPLSSAKTEEDVIKLSNYKNLQPLCSYKNRVIKRNKFKGF